MVYTNDHFYVTVPVLLRLDHGDIQVVVLQLLDHASTSVTDHCNLYIQHNRIHLNSPDTLNATISSALQALAPALESAACKSVASYRVLDRLVPMQQFLPQSS